MYNSTYLVTLGDGRSAILRVAPEPARQYRIERELMRNEYLSVPFLAPIASKIPQTLAVDFTQEIIARDYLFQTVLPGMPGPEWIGRYPRDQWPVFFRQLGDIARQIHSVRGIGFGRVAGPLFGTWSKALISFFSDLAADMDDAGLDSADVRAIAVLAKEHRSALDEIREPRLLHGDLWTVNVMMDPDATEPTITGVFDNDRTWWGDPEADWPIYMASRKPGTERDAFWEAHGVRDDSDSAALRSHFYEARHVGAIRLERHRMGATDSLPETYAQMQTILDLLGT
jgi:aminoglycoside phosphotransferase (APT) family kinase protein